MCGYCLHAMASAGLPNGVSSGPGGPEAAAGFGSPESHAPQARVDGDTTEDACETAAEENAEAEAEAEAKSESETGAEAAAEAEAKPGQSAELSS